MNDLPAHCVSDHVWDFRCWYQTDQRGYRKLCGWVYCSACDKRATDEEETAYWLDDQEASEGAALLADAVHRLLVDSVAHDDDTTNSESSLMTAVAMALSLYRADQKVAEVKAAHKGLMDVSDRSL
jgi:hypothetical protein